MAILLLEKAKVKSLPPVIREEIGGGRVQISGSMTSQEANDTALLLRAGSLAAPMDIVEERTVGFKELGKDKHPLVMVLFNPIWFCCVVRVSHDVVLPCVWGGVSDCTSTFDAVLIGTLC